MSKKTIIMLACLALALMMGLSGTLAYFTDQDSQVNVFTLGNVNITLKEEFVQNSKLMPNVEISKDAWIINEGANAAYVWMTVAVPAPLDPCLELKWAPGIAPEGPADAKDENSNDYKVYTVKIPAPLLPTESTPKLLDGIILSANVDYQDGRFVMVAGETVTPIQYDLSQVNIPVSAYAIQADGFQSFDDAYTAYGEQWGALQVVIPTPTPTSAE